MKYVKFDAASYPRRLIAGISESMVIEEYRVHFRSNREDQIITKDEYELLKRRIS